MSSSDVASTSFPRVQTPTLLYEQPTGTTVTLNRDTVDITGTTLHLWQRCSHRRGFFKTSQRDSYIVFECGTPWGSCGGTFAHGRWFEEHGTSPTGITCHTWCGCYSDAGGKKARRF
ncbi:unnamed protein product [Prorocentrum cordatum]|uniref:Uncharacterized protein n=1 Tax=Prorocentrum cordatum TaxID=2364126 RepID=A0ABN9WGB7_9DINO|nr:unnamed protein product [Polarella glacialis]